MRYAYLLLIPLGLVFISWGSTQYNWIDGEIVFKTKFLDDPIITVVGLTMIAYGCYKFFFSKPLKRRK